MITLNIGTVSNGIPPMNRNREGFFGAQIVKNSEILRLLQGCSSDEQLRNNRVVPPAIQRGTDILGYIFFVVPLRLITSNSLHL